MSKASKAIIAVASVIVLFALLFVYGIYKSNSTKIPDGTIGNIAGNIYNEGLMAERNGKIFFSNPYDDGKLYSMNIDQSDIKKLSDQRASYINAADEYVFFGGRNTDTTSGFGSILKKPNLCKVSIDGKSEKVLSQEPTQSMLLVGNSLYYQHYTQSSGENFFSMTVNNRNATEELDYLINPACYFNGSFYFNGMYDDHYLYSYNTETHTVSTFWRGNVWNPIYDGAYVYYMDVSNNYRLCRYSPATNTIEVLEQERVDCYNYYNGIIYYQISSKSNPRLMRMNADGTNQQLVYEGIFSNILITQDYTYFYSYPEGFPIYYTSTFSPVNVREFKPLPLQ